MKKLLKLLRIFAGQLDSRLAVRSPNWLITSHNLTIIFVPEHFVKLLIISELANLSVNYM